MANSLKLYEVHLFFPHLTHVNVKRKCSKMLHSAVIIGIRLLTFALSIRQRAPRDFNNFVLHNPTLKYSTLKADSPNC